jgi:hypothetical protein
VIVSKWHCNFKKRELISLELSGNLWMGRKTRRTQWTRAWKLLRHSLSVQCSFQSLNTQKRPSCMKACNKTPWKTNNLQRWPWTKSRRAKGVGELGRWGNSVASSTSRRFNIP